MSVGGAVVNIFHRGKTMSDEVEKWSQKHFGELALYRTIAATVNTVLSVLVLAKLFGWI